MECKSSAASSRRPIFQRSARSIAAPHQARIEAVAQPVAEQVEAEHGERDRDAGVDGELRAWKAVRASLSMRPHDGVGGCVPRRGS